MTNLIDRYTLMDTLAAYPRIQLAVEHEWCTLRLDMFLLNLMSDTRDGKRHGFPADVSEAIMQLQLLNLQELETAGIVEDESNLDSRFSCDATLWSLPKNF